MDVKKFTIGILVLAAAVALPAAPGKKSTKAHAKADDAVASGTPVLWQEPTDLATRNLLYGSGGEEHQPKGPYTFVKEDFDGTNPKFVVKAADGVEWKVKLGNEARPENATARITWSMGYFTTEDYFLADMHIDNMQRLKRGWKLVDADGTVHNVRLKREDKKEEKKIGEWQWKENPFVGTRELNGLKVLMALVNNWDLKDVNNAIYQKGPERIYLVSDLGASFGTAGRTYPTRKSKDNLDGYMQSRFVRAVTSDHVDFQDPARPSWELFVNPKEYMMRVHLEWIGRDIPRDDARWMGQMLSRLSPDQIRDAFRASGYSADEVDSLTSIIRERIAVLTDL